MITFWPLNSALVSMEETKTVVMSDNVRNTLQNLVLAVNAIAEWQLCRPYSVKERGEGPPTERDPDENRSEPGGGRPDRSVPRAPRGRRGIEASAERSCPGCPRPGRPRETLFPPWPFPSPLPSFGGWLPLASLLCPSAAATFSRPDLDVRAGAPPAPRPPAPHAPRRRHPPGRGRGRVAGAPGAGA